MNNNLKDTAYRQRKSTKVAKISLSCCISIAKSDCSFVFPLAIASVWGKSDTCFTQIVEKQLTVWPSKDFEHLSFELISFNKIWWTRAFSFQVVFSCFVCSSISSREEVTGGQEQVKVRKRQVEYIKSQEVWWKVPKHNAKVKLAFLLFSFFYQSKLTAWGVHVAGLKPIRLEPQSFVGLSPRDGTADIWWKP